MRALQEISDQLSDRSGVVVHEVVADGSVWFGKDSRRTNPRRHGQLRLQHRRDRQVPGRRGADLALDRRRRVPRRHARLHAGATSSTSARSSTRTATAGRRATATSSAPAWARRSSTTPSTTSVACTTSPTWRARPARRRAPTRPSSAPTASPRGSRTRGGSRPTSSTRTRSRPRQREGQPEALDRRRPDGGRAVTATASSSPAWPPSTRLARARHAREQLLQRRAARQPRPVPHRLRRRAERHRRVRDLLAQHRHPGRRRGQLRAPGRRAAAPLHGRQRGDPVLRAGDRRHARRAAGRDAGDHAVGRPARPGVRGPRRTSTAAGPAGRCSCRPGATTARPGRSCTSSSACARISATTGSRWCRRCPTGSRASRARTSAWATARPTCSPPTRATATRPPPTRARRR